MKKQVALLAVVAIVAIAYAWKKGKLNSVLPSKIQHRETFASSSRPSSYASPAAPLA